ncbi:Calmodulin-like protein 5 (Calmodulin-like skin protein) [Durusdinium trenchii]|uniref:Calmodulin-like protein 5 (Calmodulin-like skin protein) n=1 Tax=Durusdinium trenchii TaxID=1381693 RepID=A0ABP0IA64_9DINO
MSQPQQVLLLSAFKKFDINGDGTISEDELKRVMLLLDPSFTPYELDVIFSTADLSKDGSVSIEEFSHWAAEPQGIFGVVPARAVHAMSREEQAALRIQSLARGRMARKRVKPEKRKKSVERVDEAPVTSGPAGASPITRAELWEGLAFDHGRIRPKVDLYELVSGFNGCIRTGLSSAAGVLSEASQAEELLPEQVNHLALLIKTRKELVPDDEAFEELRRIKEFVRDCEVAVRVDGNMSWRHFKNWIGVLSAFSGIDASVIFFQWYWFEFGLFQPTKEVLELLLTETVYNESRLRTLAYRQGVSVAELQGKLVSIPFNLRDVMQLVYNGGLCGRSDRPCLNPSEVQALWPHAVRHMPHMLRARRRLRSAVAIGRRSKASEKGEAFKDEGDKTSLGGLEEISVLLVLLFDSDKMKSRFSSPLEMLVDMVKFAKLNGRLWDDKTTETIALEGQP